MAAKDVVKQTVKKRRLKPHIRASKTLYFLLLGLGFCVFVWFGYQVFQRASQGYEANAIEQNVKTKDQTTPIDSGKN